MSILSPDSGLLFWMLLAFIIVFVILKLYGFPVIIKMVEERKRFIDESLQNARETNLKLSNIKAESDKIIKAAREQQTEILKEAMAMRDNIIKEAHQKAVVEGHKLVEEAKEQIQTEKDLAMQEIRSQVIEISTNIAEKILKTELKDADKQITYIEKLLENNKEK